MATRVGMPENRRRKRRAKQKDKKKEESLPLEACLRLDDQTFRCVTIPGFTTILESLTTLPSSSSSSSSVTVHHHIYDKPPVSVEAAISNILSNPLPVVVADDSNFKNPFSLPGSPPSLFNSIVVGSTLYCLGGDVDDIGKQCFDDIDKDRIDRNPPFPPHISEPPRPPLRNSIEYQFICFRDSYYDLLFTPPPVNDLRQWVDPPLANDLELEQWDIATPTDTDPEQWGITTPTDPEQWGITAPTDLEQWGPNPIYSNTTAAIGVSTTTTTTTSTLPITSNTNTIKGICHKAWMFDLHNPHLGWSQGEPLISPRLYPHLVSYQGKLYAFSGNHPSLPFAEVYDPLIHTWTELPPPPFGRLADTRMFVIPLKGWNKIWVFSVDGTVDYTFHVHTGKWQRLTSARHVIPLFFDSTDDTLDFVAALNPVNHMLLYWISPQHMVYAFSLSTNQLFMGAVPGTDRVEGYLGLPFIMHHLQRDIFCLIGTGCPDDLPYESTILHVTILQISTKPPPKSKSTNPAPSKTRTTLPKPLTVAILACLSYPLKDHFDIFDTYLMSNNF